MVREQKQSEHSIHYAWEALDQKSWFTKRKQNSQFSRHRIMEGTIDAAVQHTLDEDVSTTIMRDLGSVGIKLKHVLFPPSSSPSASASNHQFSYLYNADDEMSNATLKSLKDWDLWGPLLVCLMLSIILSINAPDSQKTLMFSTVFLLVWAGGAIVTVNAQLLGGTISFFQSLSVLGYCVFPLALSALLILCLKVGVDSLVLNLIIVGFAFLWSTRASVLFMGGFIKAERRALAVFPVFFFYTFFSWLILV